MSYKAHPNSKAAFSIFPPFSFHSFIFPSINFGEQFSAKKSNHNPKSIPNLPKMIDIKKCEPPSMPPTPMTNQQSPIFATSSIAKFKAEMANNGGGGGNETAISSPFTSASTSPQSTASVQSIDAEIDVLSCTTTPMPPLDGLRLAGNGLGSDSAGSSCWGGEEKDKKYFCQRCLNHKEEHPRKGHKPFCRYRDCQCNECHMVERRRKLNNALSTRKPGEGKNGGGKGPQNGPKPRNPNCARCNAHGVESALRGHKKSLCPFRQCQCENCVLVVERRELMAAQIKLRRRQKKAREGATNQQMEEGIDAIQLCNSPSLNSAQIGQKCAADGKKTKAAQMARKRQRKPAMILENRACVQSTQIDRPQQQPYFLASSAIPTPPQHPILPSPSLPFLHFPATSSDSSTTVSPIIQSPPSLLPTMAAAQNAAIPMELSTLIPPFSQLSLEAAINMEKMAIARQAIILANQQQQQANRIAEFSQLIESLVATMGGGGVLEKNPMEMMNPFAGLTPTLIAAIQQSIVQQINQNKPSQSSDHSIESLMSIQQNQ